MTDEKKIRVAIVDDEALARDRIRQLLQKDHEVEIVAEFADGAGAAAGIAALRPDLVFLDIHMPEYDGFEVLGKLEPHEVPLIIFVTAYDKHAVHAFEVHACDYILKPFKKSRFEEAMTRAKHELRYRNITEVTSRTLAVLESIRKQPRSLSRLTVKEQNRVFFVKTSDIDWIESEDNYIRIHSAGASHLIRHSLASLEKELAPGEFVRIHRRIMVRVENIREIRHTISRSYHVLLRDGTKLPVSRGFRENLRAIFGSDL